MKDETKVGMNRTGTQLSPLLTRAMVKGTTEFTQDVTTSEMTIQDMRQVYIEESGDMGTVPIPATLTGVAQTVKGKVQGLSPEVFIDKLGERLAFERSGVRLYDALITKCESVNSELPLDMLRRFRAEEFQHFETVKAAMEKVGADPTAQTPCADASAVASMGLFQLVTDPRSNVPQTLHAILIAELADNDGWKVLVEMADEMGQPELAEEFRRCLAEEDLHLDHVRDWYRMLTFGDLGAEQAADRAEPPPAEQH